MREVLEQLTQEFDGRIAAAPSYPDQLYAGIAIADIPAIAEALRSRHSARLAAVFAEDRVQPEAAFYNYYVFERRGDPCYLILRARIPAEDPRFPSLAPGLPAVNWQERETQDWFGIEAEGHPNPRRVALHDNWPDVHPLRKDFPLDTDRKSTRLNSSHLGI